eukprot:267491_1
MTHKQATNGDYLAIPDAKEDDGWESQDISASDDEIHDTKRQHTGEIVDSSQWNSPMFKIKREPKSEIWKHSEYIKYKLFIQTKWIIIPIFLSFTLITIIISILYFLNDLAKSIAFAIILSINIIGGVLGATLVYKYGTIEQAIDFLRLENLWYEKDMNKLEKSRQTVAIEAKAIHFGVHKLKGLTKDLEEQLANFEGLRKELETICKTNESMQDKLDDVNAICIDILAAMKLNERAHLLSMYYKLVSRRNELKDHITRKDYKRFLMQLNENTRNEMEMQGGFDSIDVDNDGKVNVHEFEKLINNVLEINEEHEAVYLRKLKQLNYK